MKITHLGHAAVLLEVADRRVLFDPGNFSDRWHALTDLDALRSLWKAAPEDMREYIAARVTDVQATSTPTTEA